MMKQLDLEGLKRIELEILDVVVKFCDEHEINYCLGGGTLIGAIRHKGFIPWDDDIDLMMLRPDYDKFTELFNKYNTRYRFNTPENDPEYKRYCGRVLDTKTILYDDKWKSNIYVDIFCWDNAPNDDKALKRMFCCKKFYWYFYRLQFRAITSVPKGNILRKVSVLFLCMFMKILTFLVIPENYFAKKMNSNARKYMHEDTKRVGNFLGIQQIVVSRKAFDSFIDAEFEGKIYNIPVGYDEILRTLYGDYMQLPPEEDRVAHHEFKAYINE